MNSSNFDRRNHIETARKRIVNRIRLLRSLAGAALVCAAAITCQTAISSQTHGAIALGEIFVVNSIGDGHDAFPGDGNCETQVGNGVSGLTISDGFTSGGQFGAGIQNVNGGTINLTNCTFSRNQSEGASNPGGGGGGIYNASSGTLNIANCLFTFNLGDADPYIGNGGGIWNKTGTVHISNSTFDHNQSSYRGGAISNEGGVVTVIASTFYGNGAAQGGAIASDTGTVSVTHCTFHANIAYAFGQGVGGAIMNFNKSVLNLTNSTLTGNFSNYLGSGVYNDSTFGAVANVKSTIIALNYLGTSDFGTAPDVSGPFKSAGFNLIGKKDGSAGFTAATDKKGTIASPLNPGLDQKGLRNNGGPTQTIALLAGSVAIDKGTSAGLTGTLTTDQRGFARTVDRPVANAAGSDGTDIGAFEFGAQ
jgi:hypothetical protein